MPVVPRAEMLGELMRALGSDSVDFRTRQSDFSLDGKRAGAPWLGMKIADIEIIDLQNIPVTPPLFKQPLRTGVRLLKLKTDTGRVSEAQKAVLAELEALGRAEVYLWRPKNLAEIRQILAYV